MKTNQTRNSIFKSGSTTYYYATKFFPRSIADDVTTLYAFVRLADDYVDQKNPDHHKLDKFISAYQKRISHNNLDPVLTKFWELEERAGFSQDWVMAFLETMATDRRGLQIQTMSELIKYMYGSAEVIGLMVCRIMGLPVAADSAAKMQGRAMQYINFIRDIRVDLELERQYLPQEILDKHHLVDLQPETVRNNSSQFKAMIRSQLQTYRHWQEHAEQGYLYLPKRYRTPVTTAAKMYNWTAKQIEIEPLRVYDKVIKPHPLQVLLQGVVSGINVGLQV